MGPRGERRHGKGARRGERYQARRQLLGLAGRIDLRISPGGADYAGVRLAGDVRFQAQLRDEGPFRLEDARIRSDAASLGEIEARDHDHWGTIGVDVSPNYYVGGSYEDEVEWMTAWILARVAWLDGNMPGTCG